MLRYLVCAGLLSLPMVSMAEEFVDALKKAGIKQEVIDILAKHELTSRNALCPISIAELTTIGVTVLGQARSVEKFCLAEANANANALADVEKRQKVIEGLGLLAGLKTYAEEWWYESKSKGGSRFPSVASLGGKTGGRYTTRIGLYGNFAYAAEFLDSDLTGKLVLSYDTTARTWDCVSGTTIPAKYLPSNCK